MRVKIYVEGGGNGQALRTKCRQGFSTFFERAGFRGRMPSIVACGSRENAFESFCTGLQNTSSDCLVMLLVDSEGQVTHTPWQHLLMQDGWERPAEAVDDQVQLMVQCMESWFLADHPCLQAFYGQGFSSNALPKNTNIEQVSKSDVLKGLHVATRSSHTKGPYNKARHSFAILALVDIQRVRTSSSHAHRLLSKLESI